MLLASADELAARLRVEFDATEKAQAEKLLELASGLAQRAARQTIAQVEDDTLTLRGTRESAVRLPERPITSIKSVKLDGEEIGEDEWYIDGADLVRSRGRVVNLAESETAQYGGWGHPEVELEIVYTHGYASVPDAIKAIVIEAAARVWINPGAVESEQYGSERTSYRTTGLVLTKDEKRTVRETVRLGGESVSVR